jgi:4-amino-4-deoxy-L-arabinose transferase-like glycosyltransferase
VSAAATPAERRALWALALLAFAVLATGIGLRDPWPSDEPRFALVAKQMVESGDWLMPHRGVELYADKPPLFMDLQAAAYELTRDWRIAFLLPSLLAGLGTLLLVYDLGRRLWDRRTGLLAAWLTLFALGFTFQARRAQIDPTVTFLIVLAVYGFLRHLLCGPDWRWWVLGGFVAGLGVVTKGVGVLAFFVVLPWWWWRRHEHAADAARARGGWRWWLAPGACVLAVGLWLVPMLLVVRAHPDPTHVAYAHDLLFKQTAQRYAAAWHHEQPPWYYLEVIALQWLPLSLFLPWLAPPWWRALRARDPRFICLLGFVALILAFFSASAGKREVYILPALPLLALAAAPLLPQILQRTPWPGRCLWALCAAFALAMFGVGAWATWIAPDWGARQLAAHAFDANAMRVWPWLAAIGAGGLLGCLLATPRRPLAAATVTLAMLWIGVGFGVQPTLNDASSARGLMRAVGERLGAQGELGLVAWKEQNLLMADRPAADFGFSRPWTQQLGAAIRWQRAAPEMRWILLPESALTPCVERARALDLGIANRIHWWLFRADALMPACRDGDVAAPDRGAGDSGAAG